MVREAVELIYYQVLIILFLAFIMVKQWRITWIYFGFIDARNVVELKYQIYLLEAQTGCSFNLFIFFESILNFYWYIKITGVIRNC